MSSTATITTTLPDKVIESNYDSHPTDLVSGGTVNDSFTVQDLRNAIPAYCFKPLYRLSFWYLFRDIVVSGLMIYTTLTLTSWVEFTPLKWAIWATYGYTQGAQWTGIWVLGHEAGHGNFAPNDTVNDIVGYILHSALLTPYFSWKSTHRRHHIYANNLHKDHNYVPPKRDTYAALLGVDTEKLEEMTEDSPIVTLLRIVLQQAIGWPWYLLTNITAAPGSLAAGKDKPVKQSMLQSLVLNSHFLPSSTIFRPEEAHLILLSDIGVGLGALCLWFIAQKIGWATVGLVYFLPWAWVNHWIVVITYLHHTHPDVPKYEPEAWTFLKGATATIDRNFGFFGKHLLHNISDFHVIHHLFSRIPQYYAEEATKAIIPLLGSSYRVDKQRNLYTCLWESFTKCQWVEPDGNVKAEDRAYYYKGGVAAPFVETWMGRGGL